MITTPDGDSIFAGTCDGVLFRILLNRSGIDGKWKNVCTGPISC
jgi:hypothetical protein